ncbi:MAG: NERD domain-containing protein [Halomonadaceae bacterium]|nr:NERD domain-containing protein [Halomonadaceae bacterium]
MQSTRDAMKDNDLSKEREAYFARERRTTANLILGGWAVSAITYALNPGLAEVTSINAITWPLICLFFRYFDVRSSGRVKAVTSGLKGESYVHSLLSRISRDMVVINQVFLPNDKSRTGHTELDFILIGRKALYVVETKNNSGRIKASEHDREWDVVHPSKKRYRMRNPVKQVLIQKAVLKRCLRKHGMGNVIIQPVVAFSSPNAKVHGADGVTVPIFTRPMNDLIQRIINYERALHSRPHLDHGALQKVLAQLAEEAKRNAKPFDKNKG